MDSAHQVIRWRYLTRGCALHVAYLFPWRYLSNYIGTITKIHVGSRKLLIPTNFTTFTQTNRTRSPQQRKTHISPQSKAPSLWWCAATLSALSSDGSGRCYSPTACCAGTSISPCCYSPPSLTPPWRCCWRRRGVWCA